MHYDLIVIGMGLSGLMAAKTAADAGQKVLIVGKGTGSLGLFSNTIDLLGDLSGQMTVTEGLAEWIQNNPHHPYSTLGPDHISEVLSSFTSLFPPPYSFHTVGDTNCLIPTAAGTLRSTYLIPTTMVAGTSCKEGDSLIVGFEGFKDFYAHYVADLLKCRGVTLTFPQSFQQEMTATALARQMEKQSFRDIVGGEVKRQLKGESRVGLPAVLGLYDPIQVKRDLEHRIGAEVFEIPTLPPSIPGKRIFNRFKESQSKKGRLGFWANPSRKPLQKGKDARRSRSPMLLS
jgi:glycerol-3-phosphate dehydrogenase subunit B